ncbi:transketolase [Streptomyces sp. V3I7]|uniref:transketolase n=1 Tax=Streptomyces sp. V3I7 TaxID=3042278 RepID=UPI0027811D94|nr:transketolase [Streptomyces sp. V3I7]MDQ0994259.1 transketolase [Streptomyces sp. V3I7]
MSASTDRPHTVPPRSHAAPPSPASTDSRPTAPPGPTPSDQSHTAPPRLTPTNSRPAAPPGPVPTDRPHTTPPGPTPTDESHTAPPGPAPADLAPAPDDLDAQAAATIRLLAADAVEAAGSGHPGLPMGAAVPAWVLWSRFLRHDPSDPAWPDRDRFVLSAGHGSMLLYALLHLFGYDLPLDELRRFRQWGSATPGHPEYGHTPGVETTTGPLGQGLGNAVGMALAERMLATRCNTAEHTVVGHRTWVLAGDGDLMEGISHEAASLAGHLELGRLIVLYDDNDITIDGAATGSCRDDVLARFAAYGWQTLRVADGNDADAVTAALAAAVADETRPSLVAVRTTIGYGAPTVAGTSAAHGAPLGEAQLAATRRRFGRPDEVFHVPAAVAEYCRRLADKGRTDRVSWEFDRARWAEDRPDLAAQWSPSASPPELESLLPEFEPGTSMATRKASGAVLAAVGPAYPALVGGSADLAASTNTTIPGVGDVGPGAYDGRTLHFGIREHAMGAVLNGMALHGEFRPYGSTFLVFSDYLRPTLRLAALMKLPVVFVFTHDSIAVGEDGPTHQPVEQLESLRLVPGLAVLRPGDANETAACWQLALERSDGPTALVLSRQDLPVLAPVSASTLARYGCQVVRESADAPETVLLATGSEVALACAAAEELDARGVAVRVVSVPWRERFEEALAADPGLLPHCPAVWVEAGVPHGWRALARPGDQVIGLDRFGASAPGPVVYRALGFTVPAVVEAALTGITGKA